MPNSPEKNRPQKLYFAYGSNLYKPQMRTDDLGDPLSGEFSNRCPDSVEVSPFVLEGYRLAFVGKGTLRWGPGGVATIIPEPGGRVHGAIYRISPTDEDQLDRMENYRADDPQSGSYYKDEATISLNGEPVMTYVATERFRDEVPPSRIYLETISRGYEMWGLPVSALAEITPIDGTGEPAE